MTARLKGLLRRFPALRSLRRQLLTISLLILSVLLLLIGVLQYALMRNFTYNNRAEAMETQLHSVPRELFFGFWALPEGITQGTAGSNTEGGSFNPPATAEPSSSDESNGGAGGLGSAGDTEGTGSGSQRFRGDRRPLLLDAHTTLAIYSEDGGFRDYQDETLSESAAPRLSAEEAAQLLSRVTEKASGSYKLITAPDGKQHLAVFMSLGRPGEAKILVQMSVETAPLRDVILRQLLIFVLLSVVALLAGLFLYLPALRKTLVPLSKMGQAAQSIDAGNLDVRFPEDQGQTEIDMLSHSFNGMLERLEVSFRNEREAKEQMRRFAADASHELRTPLTSIHGFLEVLLRGAADNREQLYNALNSMHGESKRINKLVEDLLLLARMDGAPQLRLKQSAFGDVIAEMQPHLLVLAGERQVTFKIAPDLTGWYDPDKLKQLILNLFQNAVQHTHPEQGVIHISLQPKGAFAELIVRDNGSGIAAEHLPHLFDRFYRSDPSRARKYGGSGLGLSITKSIVEAHGGEISVESKPQHGSLFRVLLPRLVDSQTGAK